MQTFEQFVVVDWSANGSPKQGRDSIWWAAVRADGTLVRRENPSTRFEAALQLTDHLLEMVMAGARLLVGFDFPLGFPKGFAHALGLESPAWRSSWSLLASALEDGPDNVSNRFELAAQLNGRLAQPQFWGRPASLELEGLTAKKVKGALPELRVAERAARAHGGARPQSIWKLFTTGSVGSQALTGIPVVHRLRLETRLRDRIRVWPFETGPLAACPGGSNGGVVLAEVWPSLVAVEPREGEVKDAAQVRCLAEALATAQREGRLGALWRAPFDAARKEPSVLTEEGWILGV